MKMRLQYIERRVYTARKLGRVAMGEGCIRRNHLIYIVSPLVMLGVFTAVYTVTRHEEFDLIREGNIAAVLSWRRRAGGLHPVPGHCRACQL